MDGNKWRDIPGYEGRYQACRAGAVRSIFRSVKLLRRTCRHRDGYDKVNLSNAAGERRTFHVHTLIALTFLGPRPPGFVIDHIDGNHENHSAQNLRYLSPAQSNLNRKRRGESAQSTGELCVYRHGRGGYFVRVNDRGKKRRLGRTQTIEEAREVVQTFRALYKRTDQDSTIVAPAENSQRADRPRRAI